ncbi:hypothetical protein TD95_004179, partial [Thielaviopsis punctulata]
PAPSPIAPSQSNFHLPPNKKPRLSPPISQPQSPFVAPPSLPGSPDPNLTSPSIASPHPGGISLPMATTTTPTFATPQQQSFMASGLHLPEGAASSPVAMAQAQQQRNITATPSPTPIYTNSAMVPVGSPAPASPIPVLPGVMAPPARPSDKPGKDKEEDYDPTDSLAGTGIDIKAEEAYMANLYAIGGEDSKGSYSHHPPGSRTSMYGAGPMNQPATQTNQSQNQFVAQVAEKAWSEALTRWERSHVHELNNPFLSIANLHYRADKIARDQGLSLNLETKINPNLPKIRNPAEALEPRLQVTTKVLPDTSAVVSVTGSFVPFEANLADQLALLSLAAKTRLRTLMEDAERVARNRQTTSHGEVSEEWQIAAAELKPFKGDDVPINVEDESMNQDGMSLKTGQKRPFEASKPAEHGPPTKILKVSTNHVIQAVRETGRAEREWEERRLRRRNARLNGTSDTSAAPSRAGSVAPGTPSVAPDKKDFAAKKEPKRGSKMAEASHASQNQTSSMFAGLGGSGLFGKKRKGKTYDWMNAGAGGGGVGARSGTATPGKSGAAAAANAPAPLTSDTGRNRLGTWREDKEKGKMIQLRDWVTVLTEDGLDSRATQAALDKLDGSMPR